ncbi:uncharacterized protein ACNLHF_003101 isoform 2-T2 [Anomaloglossus baeobatrachus]|uniref:uncharacterized protein LOC142255696 isoform X2 n=1 Tax=Anomaloglossus baeobatrachus TaxID=238106 RepID=UPI003F4FE978
MKNLVAFLCMISALVGSVFSYTCIYCFSPKSTTCNETETECLGDQCMTASQYMYDDKREYWSIMKGCANETLCGARSLVRSGKVKFHFYVHCCNGDVCNTDEYEVPPEDPNPNGVKCQDAYCAGSLEDCKTNKTMNCTGSMDRCMDYREHVTDPNGRDVTLSFKGCANSKACIINFDNDIGVNVIKKKHSHCYVPSKSNHLQ